jgi:hypothetical protein
MVSGSRMRILSLFIMAESVWKWIHRLGGPGLMAASAEWGRLIRYIRICNLEALDFGWR